MLIKELLSQQVVMVAMRRCLNNTSAQITLWAKSLTIKAMVSKWLGTLAQTNLAAMYISGQGVRKDVSKAYYWLLLAQAKDASVQSRVETLEQELTPADKVRVQREVRNWKPQS